MSKASKYILPSILFSLAGTLTAQTADNCPPDPCTPPPCPPKDPCAKCAQLWPGGGPDWIVTPNAGPCVSCGADVFVSAEFLYWTVRQDGMDLAATVPQTTEPATALPTTEGKYFHADGKMEPGFKVGLGMLFDNDGWDLYANYTWLRTKNNQSITAPENFNLFLINDFENPISSVTSTWSHNFDVIDLELGRNFFISQCLHLRPHFGLKGTWQKQEWDTKATSADKTLQTIRNLDLDYWGIGIRAGLDSAWHFTSGLSFIGEAAASVLWQRFEAKDLSYDQRISDQSYFFDRATRNPTHSLHSVLELYLGLRWEDWFCCDEYHYSVEAGWEMQWWGDQNHLQKFFSTNLGGDMGLHGLTLKVRFDF